MAPETVAPRPEGGAGTAAAAETCRCNGRDGVAQSADTKGVTAMHRHDATVGSLRDATATVSRASPEARVAVGRVRLRSLLQLPEATAQTASRAMRPKCRGTSQIIPAFAGLHKPPQLNLRLRKWGRGAPPNVNRLSKGRQQWLLLMASRLN